MVAYEEKVKNMVNMVKMVTGLKFSVKIEDIKNVGDYLKFNLRLRWCIIW